MGLEHFNDAAASATGGTTAPATGSSSSGASEAGIIEPGIRMMSPEETSARATHGSDAARAQRQTTTRIDPHAKAERSQSNRDLVNSGRAHLLAMSSFVRQHMTRYGEHPLAGPFLKKAQETGLEAADLLDQSDKLGAASNRDRRANANARSLMHEAHQKLQKTHDLLIHPALAAAGIDSQPMLNREALDEDTAHAKNLMGRGFQAVGEQPKKRRVAGGALTIDYTDAADRREIIKPIKEAVKAGKPGVDVGVAKTVASRPAGTPRVTRAEKKARMAAGKTPGVQYGKELYENGTPEAATSPMATRTDSRRASAAPSGASGSPTSLTEGTSVNTQTSGSSRTAAESRRGRPSARFTPQDAANAVALEASKNPKVGPAQKAEVKKATVAKKKRVAARNSRTAQGQPTVNPGPIAEGQRIRQAVSEAADAAAAKPPVKTPAKVVAALKTIDDRRAPKTAPKKTPKKSS